MSVLQAALLAFHRAEKLAALAHKRRNAREHAGVPPKLRVEPKIRLSLPLPPRDVQTGLR